MENFWYIDGDFLKYREKRLGASDIAKILPSPTNPRESIAGYNETAVTLWQEKTGRKKKEFSSLSASMGHWLEPRTIYQFIKNIPIIADSADDYLAERMRYEVLKMTDINRRASRYQKPPILHNIEYYNDDFIVHPDGLYIPEKEDMPTVEALDLKVDLSKPFGIEAKSASFFSSLRRDDTTKGYDFDLKTEQGVPLKHLAQIQFSMAILDVDDWYLPLIYDTSKFYVWHIKRNKKQGDKLIDIGGKFMWYVKKDKEPYEFVMNSKDIQEIYQDIQDDFVMLSGDKAQNALDYAQKAKEANEQEKAWSIKKKDAQDALAILLADKKYIKTIIDGETKTIAQWRKSGGGDFITLKDIEKDDKELYNSLREKGFIKTKKSALSVDIKL